MPDAAHSEPQGHYDKQGYHVCRCGARTQYVMLTGGEGFYCPSCKTEGFYPEVGELAHRRRAKETLRVPVLLGGPGHGIAVPDDRRAVRYVGRLDGSDEAVYVERKRAAPHTTRALRFVAWDRLPAGEAFALAWDWVLDEALG